MWCFMADSFENVEDKIVEDEKRRRKLDEKGSSVKPEAVEKTEFYADKKRKEYIADNVEETKNVQ
jgi:hypothetical protein